MAQNRIFTLSEAAYEAGTDYDVVMLYQVMLGRNPENSTVIQTHRTGALNTALYTFISSPEFREGVLEPIGNGGKVRRHDGLPRPSNDQLAWLFSRAVLDESQKAMLRQAPTWEQFFQYLCSLQGFLDPPSAPPPRQARIAAPLRPRARPITPLPDAAARPPPPIAHVADPQAAPGNTAIMAKLETIEAMLADLLARSAQPRPASAAALDDPPAERLVDLAEAPALNDAAEVATASRLKPSKRRQAR